MWEYEIDRLLINIVVTGVMASIMVIGIGFIYISRLI